MKRFFLAFTTILAVGLGLAVAQNLNRSIQLSQSALGPIGVDTNNGVYFPFHVNTNQSGSPTISSFGTSASISGSDMAGTITRGTGTSTGGTLTFRTAYTSTPYCTTSFSNVSTPISIVVTPNGITLSHGSATTEYYVNYICIGRSTG